MNFGEYIHTTKMVTKAIGQTMAKISRTIQFTTIQESITIAKPMKMEEKSCLTRFVNIQFPNEIYLLKFSSRIGFEASASMKFS